MNKLFLGTTLLVGGALILTLSTCKQASNPDSKPLGTISSTTTTVPSYLEKQTADYHIRVNIPNQPLRTQVETYTLKIHDLKTNKPIDTIPGLKVEMPMGNTPMIAPTTVSKGANPGEFQVKTEFTMAGNWSLTIKPTHSPTIITLPLSVQ